MVWMAACTLVVLNLCAQGKERPLPKKDAASLRSDLDLLHRILEANHPSLYWYTPKDSVDLFFRIAGDSITDSLNEVQFKNKVSWVISRIRCGHTTVRFSKKYVRNAAHYRYPAFPLNIKAWNDSLVVLNSLFRYEPVFRRGTVITSINGRSNRSLLDTLYDFIGSDGYAMTYKEQVVSSNFPAWYKTVIGLDSSYSISYIDSAGHAATAVIPNFTPRTDTSKHTLRLALPVEKPSRRQLRKANLLSKRNLQIDTALGTAFMHLSTFSGGGLRSFFRSSFRTIRKMHLQHLVIDLRENGGGRVSASKLLTRYLVDHSFKIGDSLYAISRKFEYGRYIHPAWPYWFAMNFNSHKDADGFIHYRHYERTWFSPKTRNHFSGHVTLVQGGLTFSAATMFIATVKGQKNVTVAGEESGGGYYGNTATYLPTIELPVSRLRITLPLYRLVMDASRPKGHGVIPDLEIPPSSAAIRSGIDIKMRRIRELIQQSAL